MTDEYRAPTGGELCDSISRQLPHDTFELAAVRGYGISGVNGPGVGEDALVVRCRCGRVLRWPAGASNTMPMDTLLYWLADHDDDMFLTPEQLDAKHDATIPPMPVPLTEEYVAKYANRLPDGGRPLAYDPDGTLGLLSFARDIAPSPYEAARDSAWDAVRADYDEAHTNTATSAYDIEGTQ